MDDGFRPVRGVAFDMDGLMFDTERIAIEGWLAAGRQMGLAVTPELVLLTLGIDETGTHEILVDRLGTEIDFPLFRRLRLQYADDWIRQNGIPVKPGLVELLTWLKSNGYRITMATSTASARARSNLEEAGLSEYFTDIAGGDMVARGKPAPDIYLKAAALMGLPPGDCMALEDSPTGILSAWRAGMKPVMVPDLIEPDDATGGRLFARLASLRDVIPLLETLPRPCG
ncbi:MAG: HAD family phosphatase [Clostridia bacterium]|nr:HAD family phosphatase [Clostridia bacterium]